MRSCRLTGRESGPAYLALSPTHRRNEGMIVDVLLAPDVYVNASVALGSAPDQVVQRALGRRKGQTKTTEWVLARVRHMLAAVPEFKKEAVDQQVALIRSLVDVIETNEQFA